MPRYPVDSGGKLIAIVVGDGPLPAGTSAEASGAPSDGANDRWNGTAWVHDLQTAINARCADVDTLRDAKFSAGMSYSGKTLQLRDVDQQRIIAAGAQAKFALLTSSSWPSGFGWIMADNSVLPLSAAGMSAMADAASTQVSAWIFNGYALKQAIRALSDPAAVAAYDISTGW